MCAVSAWQLEAMKGGGDFGSPCCPPMPRWHANLSPKVISGQISFTSAMASTQKGAYALNSNMLPIMPSTNRWLYCSVKSLSKKDIFLTFKFPASLHLYLNRYMFSAFCQIAPKGPLTFLAYRGGSGRHRDFFLTEIEDTYNCKVIKSNMLLSA